MTPAATVTHDGLRAWAKGLYPTEAAVELLIRGFRGRFAGQGQPWIQQGEDPGAWWVDVEALALESGALSGGEQRFLSVVASLLDDEYPVMLGSVLAGLDRECVKLVLAGVAHAAGSHESSAPVLDPAGRVVGFTRPGTLYTWPEPV